MAQTASGVTTAELVTATGNLVTQASAPTSSLVVLEPSGPLFTATASSLAPVVVVVTSTPSSAVEHAHSGGSGSALSPGLIAGISASGAAVVLATLALVWARRRKVERRRTMAFNAARARARTPSPAGPAGRFESGQMAPGPSNDLADWRDTFHDHPDESAYDILGAGSAQSSPLKDLHSPTFDLVDNYTRNSHLPPMSERSDSQPIVIDGRERDPFMRSPLSMIGGGRHERIESAATGLSSYSIQPGSPPSPARPPHPSVAAAQSTPWQAAQSSRLAAPPQPSRQSSNSSGHAEFGYAL